MSRSYFKYLSVAGASAVLSTQTLRWATCLTFNDPADLQIELEVRCDRRLVVESALDLIWQRCLGKAPPTANKMGKVIDESAPRFLALGETVTKASMRHAIEAGLDNLPTSVNKFSNQVLPDLARIKLICFSEIKNSTLMWSHYGENHSGLVLEFKDADGYDSVYKMARPINYSRLPPQFSNDENLSRFLAGDESIDSGSVDAMIYTKAEEWRYEKELRIASGEGRESEKQIEYARFVVEELVGVYFGCRASEGTRNLLIPLIREKYKDAFIWQARRAPHSYELDFELLK